MDERIKLSIVWAIRILFEVITFILATELIYSSGTDEAIYIGEVLHKCMGAAVCGGANLCGVATGVYPIIVIVLIFTADL